VHEYDTALKALLQGSENSIFEKITGVSAGRGRWLNVELPEVQQTRVDLLFETLEPSRRLIGLELQSANDPSRPLRMAEYSLRVYRIQKQFPEQYVLYVGDQDLTMASELAGPNHICRYTIIDIRDFDEEILLNSPFEADNILAILMRHKNRRETIRRILKRIAILKGGARYAAFAKLLIIAGLRELEDSIHTEVRQMPILNDIMDHKVLGPAIRQGLEQGRKEGKEEGKQEGKQEEGLAILRKQIAKRFGRLPGWAEERLAAMSVAELEDLSIAVLDANTAAELFDR
jgi:predicted transposase YdaD